MRHSTRSRIHPAAALLIAVALAGAPPRALALAPPETVVARVNGERITEADVLRALQVDPGLNREKALERLIEESLIVQEARRRKFDGSSDYLRMIRRWRQDTAVGLIGIDTLRRHVAKAGGSQPSFKEFYPGWEAVHAGLPKGESAAVDAAVESRLGALKSAVSAVLDRETMKKYVMLVDLPPEQSSKVVAAQTSFGPITLEDLMAEEPMFAEHGGQSEEEVLKMWQQLAREIAGRNHILQTAEKAGLFKDSGMEKIEELARRDALRTLFLDKQISGKITRDALIAKIDRQIATWTATHAIAIEQIRLAAQTRVEADAVATAWKNGEPLPASVKVESLSMTLAWAGFTLDQKRLIIDQQWGRYLPSMRVGDGFVLLHLMAASPPREEKTLRDLAQPLLFADMYRELISKLTREARITGE